MGISQWPNAPIEQSVMEQKGMFAFYWQDSSRYFHIVSSAKVSLRGVAVIVARRKAWAVKFRLRDAWTSPKILTDLIREERRTEKPSYCRKRLPSLPKMLRETGVRDKERISRLWDLETLFVVLYVSKLYLYFYDTILNPHFFQKVRFVYLSFAHHCTTQKLSNNLFI